MGKLENLGEHHLKKSTPMTIHYMFEQRASIRLIYIFSTYFNERHWHRTLRTKSNSPLRSGNTTIIIRRKYVYVPEPAEGWISVQYIYVNVWNQPSFLGSALPEPSLRVQVLLRLIFQITLSKLDSRVNIR